MSNSNLAHAASKNLLQLYKRMQLIRQTELIIAKNYQSNLMKTPVHLANGAEAIACGVLSYIKNPRVFGTYRNHHWYLELTDSVDSLLLELLGKQTSPNQGRAGSMHLSYPEKGLILTSAIVSSTIPIAVGDAWAGMSATNKSQTVAFFGDGATEEGVFFESLNFAALKKIPILFVCEDNELAIHSMRNQRQSFDIEKSVSALDIPYFFTEAYKIENVIELMSEVTNALKNGPAFLHLKYYRMLSHVGIEADFDQGYRVEPSEINSLDPVWNCEQSLVSKGVNSQDLSQILTEIQNKINESFRKNVQAPDADERFVSDYIFAKKLT